MPDYSRISRIGFYVLLVMFFVVSATLVGFSERYYDAYNAPEGEPTEEQGDLIDISNRSYWIGWAGMVLSSVAIVFEIFAQKKAGPLVDAIDADDASEASMTSEERRLVKRFLHHARIRYTIYTIASIVLAAVCIVYAVKMWRNGTHPMVKVKRRVLGAGKRGRKKHKWIKTEYRKPCLAAKRSHCDKLDDLGNSLIAASVVVALLLLQNALVLKMAFEQAKVHG